MAAALIAGDLEDLHHRNAADVAGRRELAAVGHDQQARLLQGRRHLSDGDSRQPEIDRERAGGPALAAVEVRPGDEVHQFEGQLLQFRAGQAQLREAQAQIRRVLYVERQLGAGKQDQPAQIGPQQRRDDERETGINDLQPRRIDDEGGE